MAGKIGAFNQDTLMIWRRYTLSSLATMVVSLAAIAANARKAVLFDGAPLIRFQPLPAIFGSDALLLITWGYVAPISRA